VSVARGDAEGYDIRFYGVFDDLGLGRPQQAELAPLQVA